MTDESSPPKSAFAASVDGLDEASYFQTLVENTSDAILTLDEESTIVFANAAVERLLGYQPNELVGQSATQIIPERLRQRHVTALNHYLETDERSLDWDGTELSALHKNGHKVPISITFREHKDNGHRLFTGIIRDISAQKTREQQLRHQRDILERVRQVTESLRLTNQILVRASTRDEIEQMVCDRLASSVAYTFAWIGNYISENKQIEPHTWGGVEDDYLSAVEITADESDTGYGPAGRAVRTRSVQIVQNIRTNSTFEPWREEALQRGYRAVAAVPLRYGETIYGVLIIYSSRAFAFDEYEQTLLSELGERIGHAIHAADNQQLLHIDTVVELTFQSTESDVALIEASDHFACELTLETITPVSNQGFVCYTTVEGAAPEAVCERLRDAPEIDQARPIRTTGEMGAIEYTITGESPSVTLIEYGATLQAMTSEQGEATIIGEIAPDTNTCQIIERMQTAHPEITFIAKQTRDRPAHSADGVDWHVLADVLTARQREVLEVAYHAGYFASPRETTGEELAEVLDIASPTF